MQIYWNHTSAWVISSKFAACLQNVFSEEHLWRAVSGQLHCNEKHTVSCSLSLSTVIIHQFNSCTKILALIPFIPTRSSPHFHPDPRISCIPTLISNIPTLISNIPTLIPRIPIIPFILFPDSPFWLLQIVKKSRDENYFFWIQKYFFIQCKNI